MHVSVTLKITSLEELANVLEAKTMEELKREARYNSTTFSVNVDLLSDEEAEKFAEWLKSKKARQGYLKVRSYMDVKNDPDKATIKGLENFQVALTDLMKKECPNKWIFIKSRTDEFLPYLVSKISYEKPYGRGDQYIPPYVKVSYKANTMSGCSENSISFYDTDISGTVKEILANKGIVLENETMMKDFKEVEDLYLKEKKKFNKQYKGNGIFITGEDRWRTSYIEVTDTNFVNDEEINKNSYYGKSECPFWANDEEDGILRLPHHPYLYVYSLKTYENGFIHISSLKDYEYDDSLRDKLVLPSTHRDLIDILSDDLTVLAGDIVDGKSTGTTILCKGVPGTGKTLTAEVYSEITHRPLYKVNAGVLGLHYGDIEKNLEEILKRAERWNAVLLIDEADTYIRKRGNDNEQNAVVAAFLRTLEYFNGLLFLTTNRADDIDDAIESRCIAQILYEVPTPEDAKRIWKVLSTEFELELSDKLIDDLVETFPGVSGRDIKELLRLTGRFCNGKGYKIELKHFISCAQFRGLHIEDITKKK